MSGLSLMQTRSYIDRLGDLDEEITKVCRAADVMAKEAGKEHASGVDRLKEARDALEEKQKYVREAKDHLLGFDGFLHALSGDMRELMEHPRLGNAVSRISDRMSHPLTAHVHAIVEEVVDGLRRVSSAVKALREAKADSEREGSVKESAKALSKVCEVAEKTIRKAIKFSKEPPEMPEESEPEEEEVEEVVVEKAAGDLGYHGYQLTAGLPPEFLENAKKKKEEAKGKAKDEDDKDDEKKSSKKADSRVPGNESKGPKEEGEEDQGWVPGHRTTQAPTDEKKGGKKKADSKDPDPSMEEDLPGEDDDGKPVVDKAASDHGYDLFETPDHGYQLFA